MTKEGWRELVVQAVAQAANGNAGSLHLLAEYLAETDRAKQILRDKGYGCTGMGIARTAMEVYNASDCCEGDE